MARTSADGQPVEHPASLAEAVDQPRLGQQLQMAADARLALAENLGQILDVEVAALKQRQQAQPGRVAAGAQACEQRLKPQLSLFRHPRSTLSCCASEIPI